MKIRENIPIATLTTMKIGGPARYIIEITDTRDVRKAYKFAFEKNLPVWVLGSGANTIGRDEGFPGVIILNRLRGIEIEKEIAGHLTLKGMGGEIWDNFVAFACHRGYSGIELLSGIPGTLGAAPVQNIGAYGQDLSQVLQEVFAYDSKKDRAIRLPAKALRFGYRQSILNTGPDVGRYFVISVTLNLERRTLSPPFYQSLQAYIDEHQETDFSPENLRRIVLAIRQSKLPDPSKEPSAGSFFKNIIVPAEKLALFQEKGYPLHQKSDGTYVLNTGWLIEEAGLKDTTHHGFRISDKAALILINDSATTYADLAKARAEISAIIKDKFDLDLAQEPVEVTKL